ncbi:hypothetical protein V1514DRAFT_352660 [Lipomyces japonicus]|uniref:uncharacterized protein n=1 Tax=Lipomyces japonicus TaxID=56871 RepID=UPI0034CEA439
MSGNSLIAPEDNYSSSSLSLDEDSTADVEAGYVEIEESSEDQASDEYDDDDEEENENPEEDDDEEEEDDDEEDDDDDDDDDDYEPRLKYTRIVNLPPTLFSSDPLSAFLAHDDFLVFATHGGTLHITTPDLKSLRTYRAHSASILSLSTDGVSIASASLDGRVVIASVTDPKDVSASDFLRPVHAVSLDPNFQSSRTFVSGGTACSLILSEKGWLGRQTDSTLLHGDGPINATDWTGDIIVAMNDSGIHLYHAPTRSRISRISLPKNAPRADLYRPRLSWVSPTKFIVGWAYTIWIIKVIKSTTSVTPATAIAPATSTSSSLISTTPTSESGTAGPVVTERKSEVETILSIDGLVSGVLRYDDDALLILAYNPPPVPTDDNPRPLALTPELRLVSPSTGEELSADQLSLRGYERLGANDYHLGVWDRRPTGRNSTTPSGRKFFVLSARDGVITTERDEQDRFEWLLEKNKFEEAWKISPNLTDPAVDDTRRREIGVRWVESLIEVDDWQVAGAALKQVLAFTQENDDTHKAEVHGDGGGDDDDDDDEPDEHESETEKTIREEWERWAWAFVRGGHVADIASYLPVRHPQLSSVIYEMVLGYYLANDRDRLYDLLNLWPIEIYDSKSIIALMENKLKDEDDRKLRQKVAHLYVLTGNPAAAILHLLHIQDPAAIDLIRDQHLLQSLLPSIPEILTISLTFQELEAAPVEVIRRKSADAVDLVVEGRLELLPQRVVDQVMKSGMEVMAFLYLERLTQVDGFAAQEFADLQVNLYADYDRPKLLEFVKRSNSYNLEKASEICERRGYIPELVYILGKTGENKKALMLIINRLDDVEQAIQFAKTQDDKELWADLVDYSMDKPKFIRGLLEQAGTAIDPITLVRRIKEGMAIEGLKPALQRILREHELTLSIAQGASAVVRTEVETSSARLRTLRARAIRFDQQQALNSVTNLQFGDLDTLIQFTCGHVMTERQLLIRNGYHNATKTDNEDDNQAVEVFSAQSAVASSGSVKSVAQKVTHLAYIKEKLKIKECPICLDARIKAAKLL